MTSDACDSAQFSLEEATIQSVQTAIKCRKITCEQLINAYLDRIKKYNLSANEKVSINAIARINENVIDQARSLDALFASGEMKGPLHCTPVLLKDNIDSYDSPSLSGSLSMLGNQATHDAFLTKKLRDAGAIILGKSTMDEFASGVSGISGANGRTGNVYNREKNSGGSSSGSAAAVSANFTMIAIGTDNSGSVRIPAAFNGVFGLRPSTGLVSQQGIFPRGNLDAIAGPMTRTVEDLAIVLNVIAQPDPLDSKTLYLARPENYIQYLNKDSFRNKRIGILRQIKKIDIYNKMTKDTQLIFEKSISDMENLGAVIVDDIRLPKFILNRQYNEAGEREDINAYLAAYPAVRKDYYDICDSERTRVFGTSMECFEFVRNLPKKNSTHYYEALNTFSQNTIYVKKIMDQHHLDALLIPVSMTGSATYDSKMMLNEEIASNAGLPGITLNIGYSKTDHLPIGIELIGKQFAEGELIGMAYDYEQHFSPRETPIMLEKSDRLEKLDIAHYNNLLTNIGYRSFQNVLNNCKPDKFSSCLTPVIFQKMVQKEIAQLS